MQKRVFNVVMTGVLSLGVLGAAGLPALAASDTSSATQEKVETIMDNLRTKLEVLGVTMPEHSRGGHHLAEAVEEAKLDEAAQAKAEAVLAQLEEKTITKEEAEEQLAALGVEATEKNGRDGFLNGLDEETKAKAEAILSEKKAGTITKEEAEEQLAALGIEATEKNGRDGRDGFLNGLDEETKAKAEAILSEKKAGTITKEEAQTQLETIGVTLPERRDPFADLGEEAKAKAEVIMEQVKSGELAREEAEAQLEALGVELPSYGGRHGQDRGKAMLEGLDEETKAEAESLIEAAEQQLEELGIEKSPIQ